MTTGGAASAEAATISSAAERSDNAATVLGRAASVNARSARGESPLQAVIVGRRRTHEFEERLKPVDQEKMRLLLDAGADVHARDKDGYTPLHRAAASDRDDLAALLIAHGADVDARSDEDRTPLHFAAEQGHTAVVELLLEKGADINAETKDRRTPLNLVWGNDAMKSLLERHGARMAWTPR